MRERSRMRLRMHCDVSPPLVAVRLPDQPLSRRMRIAIDFIEAKFTDMNLSVEQVADHIGVTAPHLARLFQRSLGRTPLEILNDFRINYAGQLFEDPRLNLTEVAGRCGYRSTRQLNRWLDRRGNKGRLG